MRAGETDDLRARQLAHLLDDLRILESRLEKAKDDVRKKKEEIDMLKNVSNGDEFQRGDG